MRMASRQVDSQKVPPNEAYYATPGQVFLTAKKQYTAYAVSLYDGVAFVLVVDDLYTPVFLPAFLFETIEHSIPADWVCTLLPDTPVKLILGPAHIAADLASYNSMVDQDAAQVEHFWARIDSGRTPPPWGETSAGDSVSEEL